MNAADPVTRTDAPIGAGEAVRRVVADGRAYAMAQVDLAKAIAGARWRAAKTGVILLVVAVLFVIAAVVALPVGLILALAPLIGPLFATLVVVAATLVVAFLLAKSGAGIVGRAMEPMA